MYYTQNTAPTLNVFFIDFMEKLNKPIHYQIKMSSNFELKIIIISLKLNKNVLFVDKFTF